MRICDIIKPNIPCRLTHPIIGDVYWGIKDGCWGLYFAKGNDANKFLVADDAVLISDEWEQANRLSTDHLAGLIADALIPKCLKKENFDLAVEIITEEIDARKGMGDY